MIHQNLCEIVENEEVAVGHFKMTVKAPAIVNQYKPGQFVTVQVSGVGAPLIRKPFGVYECDEDENTIAILYKVIGKGTQLLSEMVSDMKIDVMGPLGNGIDDIDTSKKTAVIAGGIGIAAVAMIAENLDGNFDLFYGVKTAEELVDIEIWDAMASKVFITSDDGTIGEEGFVTSVFEKRVKEYEQVFVCGPQVMMKTVFQICQVVEIPSWFLLEEYMACGVGLCMGCVCETKEGYKRVCKEGPVFKGEEIKW
jgi:dihydroorotate dehydrogenase electron transfer subunit